MHWQCIPIIYPGAHTIGRTPCGGIQHRLYQGLNGTSSTPNPPLDDHYLDFLQRKCRCASGDYVDLDATTPTTFDSQFYANLQKNMGLLSTDQMLYSDPRTSPVVNSLIGTPSLFIYRFSASMVRLANIQVLSGLDEAGEIRTNCNFVNSYDNWFYPIFSHFFHLFNLFFTYFAPETIIVVRSLYLFLHEVLKEN